MTWGNGCVEWTEGDTAFLSVVFSWHLQNAYQRAVMLSAQGYHVRAGGPAVANNPDFLADVAEIGGQVNALPRHNPDATFTSRGCIRRCSFCAVPKIEGALVELDDWPVKPIVCDNNLLACSRAHFDSVIDKLQGVKGVDFNQGLDMRLLTEYYAQRLATLNLYAVRLAWDHSRLEGQFRGAYQLLREAGIPAAKIRVYVLIGYDDTPEDAIYRLETIRGLGSRPNPMRYQPLDVTRRNGYLSPNWTEREMRRVCHYYSRLRWLEHIPFAEYERRLRNERQNETLANPGAAGAGHLVPARLLYRGRHGQVVDDGDG